MDRLMTLYDDEAYNVPSIKRAVVRFLLAGTKDTGEKKDENTKKADAEPPLKEVPTATIGSATAVLPAHVGHALECLATLEKKDPKTVNEAKRFFLLK